VRKLKERGAEEECVCCACVVCAALHTHLGHVWQPADHLDPGDHPSLQGAAPALLPKQVDLVEHHQGHFGKEPRAAPLVQLAGDAVCMGGGERGHACMCSLSLKRGRVVLEDGGPQVKQESDRLTKLFRRGAEDVSSVNLLCFWLVVACEL
jgi:hypothetical protein